MSRQTRISGRASVVTAAAVWFLCIGVADLACAQSLQDRDHPEIRLFLQATAQDGALAGGALRQIAAGWRDGYAGIVWDLARSVRPPGPQLFQFFRLVDFLQQQTGQEFGADLVAWQDWIWDQPYDPHPDYASFKGALYGEIDRRFAEFFPSGVVSLIRLDEVVWGGVAVNGIPPLDHPAWIAADEAGYLADEHVVFGLAVNGETRAYPKRILAWHEMALDRLGGIELTIVYCTLCGTVIPYESVVNGRPLTFGTSGLLYRSNKLMFDHETRSLWNTFEGVPVVGTLAGGGLQLTPLAVVTTTWGEWRRIHPTTTVLSLDTGHRRNYSEGAAYRDYFSTNELMFQVGERDGRLPNKAEVLVMRLTDPGSGEPALPLAISEAFLGRQRVFHHRFAGRNLVVVTSRQGANRVYDAQDLRVVGHLDEQRVVDQMGRVWRIGEDALMLDTDFGVRRPRIPAQRAFWFGWYAQFPNTELIR